MWQRFTLDDVRTIGHYLGVLILFLAASMAVPFVVALAFQEWKRACVFCAWHRRACRDARR